MPWPQLLVAALLHLVAEVRPGVAPRVQLPVLWRRGESQATPSCTLYSFTAHVKPHPPTLCTVQSQATPSCTLNRFTAHIEPHPHLRCTVQSQATPSYTLHSFTVQSHIHSNTAYCIAGKFGGFFKFIGLEKKQHIKKTPIFNTATPTHWLLRD